MTTSEPTKKKSGRSRYDEEHPIRSFRLRTRESNERLQAYLEATGSSLSDLIERALNGLPLELPDMGKVKDAEYARGYYEGYEDGYERGKGVLPYPTNLMTRRAREKVIEVFKKTGGGYPCDIITWEREMRSVYGLVVLRHWHKTSLGFSSK